MVPVVVSRLNPVGRLGLTDHEVTGPPELLGVAADIADPDESVSVEAG